MLEVASTLKNITLEELDLTVIVFLLYNNSSEIQILTTNIW